MKKDEKEILFPSKKEIQSRWQFEPTGDLYKDLALRESSGKSKAQTASGKFMGFYQMGPKALADIGFIKTYIDGDKKVQLLKDKKDGYIWTGKFDINSREDFLSNPLIQEIAVRQYHEKIWNYLKEYWNEEGRIIGGIKLTKSGMIAAGHLVGIGGIKLFIKSNGQENDDDQNDTKCSEYLAGFQGYDVDLSIDKFVYLLEKEKKEKKLLEKKLETDAKFKEMLEEYAKKVGTDLDKFHQIKEEELKSEDRLELQKMQKILDEKKAQMQSKLDAEIKELQTAMQAKHDKEWGERVTQATAEHNRTGAAMNVNSNDIVARLTVEMEALRIGKENYYNQELKKTEKAFNQELSEKRHKIGLEKIQIFNQKESKTKENFERTQKKLIEKYEENLQDWIFDPNSKDTFDFSEISNEISKFTQEVNKDLFENS